MSTGTIVLIPFPFAELTNVKVRPAIVIANTKDKHQDLILCAISSVIPSKLGMFEMKLFPNSINQLRVLSIIRIDRIATLKRENIITTLGKISEEEVRTLVKLFRQLVD